MAVAQYTPFDLEQLDLYNTHISLAEDRASKPMTVVKKPTAARPIMAAPNPSGAADNSGGSGSTTAIPK